MDPISQAGFGATFSQNVSKIKDLKYASLIGVLSGMAADLDVLIRSKKDALLFLDFHRQFTHSLIFIPFGSLLCAAFFYWFFFRKKKISFKKVYFFSFFGYASHGLLDACTSYGTLLFWPFSHMRVAWNNVSIIDPLFTLPVLFFVIFAYIKENKRFSRLALTYAILYLALGFVQEYRARQVLISLAKERGHTLKEFTLKPSFANLILWKSIYLHDGVYYVDALHVFKSGKIFTGESIKKLDPKNDLPWLQEKTQQGKDLKRFAWFSQGYLALDPKNPYRVVDVRYSLLPQSTQAIWGIDFNPQKQDDFVRYTVIRSMNKETWRQFFDMLFLRSNI